VCEDCSKNSVIVGGRAECDISKMRVAYSSLTFFSLYYTYMFSILHVTHDFEYVFCQKHNIYILCAGDTDCSTRLETRTKEFNSFASHIYITKVCGEAKAIIRKINLYKFCISDRLGTQLLVQQE